MDAVATIVWLIMAVVTARLMYSRWRPRIADRFKDPAARCTAAAVISVFTCLFAWWAVGLVMIVMARPKITDVERQRQIDTLEHQLGMRKKKKK
jgi:hypothetical protein